MGRETRPMDILNIIRAIDSRRYEITDHADEKAQDRQLDIEDIFHSVRNGEIIKNYPKDKPNPSCLIYGKDRNEEPIHSVWAYDEKNEQAISVTAYRPDPEIWLNWRERRKT